MVCQATMMNVFSEGGYVRKNIEFQLKQQRKWGSRDRRLYAETCYELVRWWRLLFKLSGLEYSSESKGAHTVTAADVEKVIETYLKWRENSEAFREKIQNLTRAERESVPDWLDVWGEKELKKDWDKTLTALNKQARQYLRANTLKTNRKILKGDLLVEKIATELVEGVEDALMLTERRNVFTTKSYLKGDFEMQDVGSQMISRFVQPQAGERVIDACAGAGGKTLHLAALMKNSGKIIALDTDDKKLLELRKRASRAGATSIEIRHIENLKVIKRLYDTADRLLLDVPCSGLGVLRRNPDYKWKLNPEALAEIRATQAEILDKYSPMVKVGGYLIYSTCSIAPSENQEQVRTFIDRQKGQFEIEEELKVSLIDTDFDGFYAARLKRISKNVSV